MIPVHLKLTISPACEVTCNGTDVAALPAAVELPAAGVTEVTSPAGAVDTPAALDTTAGIYGALEAIGFGTDAAGTYGTLAAGTLAAGALATGALATGTGTTTTVDRTGGGGATGVYPAGADT